MIDFTKYHDLIIHETLRVFCEQFNDTQIKIKKNLLGFGIDVKQALPEVFQGVSLEIEAAYSRDRKQVFFNFKRSKKFSSITYVGSGDVIDYLDKTGLWANSNPAFAGSATITFKNINFEGLKPFRLYGSEAEIYITDMSIILPNGQNTKIEYGIGLSYEKFLSIRCNLEEYLMGLFMSYWSFFIEHRKKLEPGLSELKTYIDKLEVVARDMEYYFFEDHVSEKQIEDFVKENSVVLEEGLGLIKPYPQLELTDVLGKYSQTLKPDVIALNPITERWVIVDYKLGRRSNLVKSPNGVRTTFYAQVHALEAQLRIYRKYFDEHEHRKYFKERYGFYIDEYPDTIGIVGIVDEESRKDFQELLGERPRWFNLVPYNDFFKKFVRFVETLKKLQ